MSKHGFLTRLLPLAALLALPPAAQALPTVDNAGGASNLTVNSATLNGNLVADGGDSNTFVRLYWNTTDGGTDEAAWTNVCDFGVLPVGVFATNVTGLTSNTTYYYRCWASNGAGVAWAPKRTLFSTGPFLPPAGMVLIPAGVFQMGDTFSEGNPEELPVHTNFVSAFFMEKFEVTYSQWTNVHAWATNHGYAFVHAGAGQAADHPVYDVDWFDAVKWCNARSEMEGLAPVYYTSEQKITVYRSGEPDLTNACVAWAANGYRLPTEAEWEKAARGGLTGVRYPWGDSLDGSKCNYIASGDPFEAGADPDTTPVGYYDGGQTPSGVDMANGYDLYDMAGNVWEWVWDKYLSNYYSVSPANDPHGPDTGDALTRGGGWNSDVLGLRCSHRGTTNRDGIGTSNCGFRCARSAQTAPVVDNSSGASAITATSATFNGNLVADGGDSNTFVRLYWNTTDGGTDEAAWTNVCDFGVLPVGVFATNVTGLTSNTLYYYRAWASNGAGVAWAPESTNFTTLASQPPVWTSVPITNAMVGQVYSYTPTATDADNDPLAYSAPTLPAWLTLGTNLEAIIRTIGGTRNVGDNGPGAVAQVYRPFGVAVDGTGNVYVADTINYRIRKIEAGTGIIRTIAGTGVPGYSGDGAAATNADLFSPHAVAVDGAGNVYVADADSQRIRKIEAGTGLIRTIAGTGSGGYDGDGVAATNASLNGPCGVAVDGAGNVYVADTYNHRIRKIEAGTGLIRTVAGTGSNGYNGDGGTASNAQVNAPFGVAVDGAGNVYVADTENQRIRKIEAGTGLIRTVAGKGGAGGYDGDGVAATNAFLADPGAVAVDESGNVYVADTGNQRIRKIEAGTGMIRTIAGTGVPTYDGDGVAATNASLFDPWGVAVGGAGDVYVADTDNCRVRQIEAGTGLIRTIAGTGSGTYNGDNIPATRALVSSASGVDIDLAGNVYVADTENHRIRKIEAGTGIIRTIAGTGMQGYNGDDIAATNASLSDPSGVAVDGAGNLYVADKYNNRIRKIESGTGIIRTIAGTGSWGYNGDDIAATNASLSGPSGVAVDGAGHVYVADAEANRIRKIEAGTGIIRTIAGTGSGGYNGDDIAATNADLNVPWGVAVDGATNVYVADYLNCRIRKIEAGTGIIRTIAGTGSNGYNGDDIAATNAMLLNSPGLALDAAGNVYVPGGTRVRKIEAGTGLIRTIAGTSAGGYNGDGMAATAAILGYAAAVAVDAAGNVYVVDTVTRLIRKIEAAGVVVSGTPGLGDVGLHNVVLAVSDGVTSVPQAFDITVQNGVVSVQTLPASAVTLTSATLNGYLADDGGDTNTFVRLYWNTSDGGTDEAAWTNVCDFGVPGVGAFATNLTGLTGNTTYYCRAWASNAAGVAWAPASASFHTLGGPTPIHYVDVSNASPSAPYASWATAATRIQDAVNAASDGDTVLVTNGVYNAGGVAVIATMTNRVAITNAIAVQGVNGPAYTFIVGQPCPTNNGCGDGAVRCALVASNAVLSGFTLTNGFTRATGNIYEQRIAGGVWCEDGALVTNCVIVGNGATVGGGAYRGNFVDCILRGNSASNWAGGICYGSLKRCTLSGNRSVSDGGGAWASALYDCLLSGNVSSNHSGAAHYCFMDRCRVVGNIAPSGGGTDGSVASNTLFQGNSATYGGAAYYAELYNCTLVGNAASVEGGGANNGRLTNCIVYNNQAPSGSNWIWSAIGYSCTAPAPGGPGNVTAPPQFADPANSNFHLDASSPCIDSGLTAAAPGPADLDGKPRVVHGVVDMGAYEYAGPLVDNAGGATVVLVNTATLNGNLVSTGVAATAVAILWGPADGGTNEAAWSNRCDFGVQPVGPFATNLTGLASNTTYYYRCWASNGAGVAWAPAGTNFTTLASIGPDRYWDAGGGADQDWSTAVNWYPDLEPVASNTAYVGHGSYTMDAHARITQPGETCANLYVGFGAMPTGTIEMASGSLSVANRLQLDRGRFVQSGGAVTAETFWAANYANVLSRMTVSNANFMVTSNFSIGMLNNATCVFEAVDSTVTVKGLSGIVAGPGTAVFSQSGGNVGFSNGLSIGSSSVGTGTYSLVSGGGLTVSNGLTVAWSGVGTFDQGTGTVVDLQKGSLTVGGAAGGRGQYTLNGGNLSNVFDIVIGQGASGTFNQVAGNIQVGRVYAGTTGGTGTYVIASGALVTTNTLVVGNGNGTLGTLRICSNATVTCNNPNMTIGASGGGAARGLVLLEGGTLAGNSPTLMRQTSSDAATLQGWGQVTRSAGFQMQGRTVADGYGVDRTLTITNYGNLSRTLTNLVNETNGWFAVNRGKLLLKDVAVSGAGFKVWGDVTNILTLVNSFAANLASVTNVGALRGALLAPDHGEVPGYDPTNAKVVAVWSIVKTNFTYGNGAIAFRYDHSKTGTLGLAETDYRIYYHPGTEPAQWAAWTNYALVLSNRTITASNVAAFGYFAIGSNIVDQVFAITPSWTAHGYVTPGTNVFVTHGYDSTAFTIVPDADAYIADVRVNGVSVGATSAYTFLNVTSNQTIHADFALIPPLVTNVYPAVNALAGSNAVSAKAWFNVVMDPATVTSNAFFLYSSLGNTWQPAPVYNPTNRTATATPAAAFRPGEVLYADATRGMAASNGAALDPYLWQFLAPVSAGSGQFVTDGQALGSGDDAGVALVDLDRDGDLDAVVANWGAGSRVYRNDGAGVFADSGQSLGTNSTRGVAAGDLNRDGWPDAVFANYGQASRVYTNDRAGHLIAAQAFGTNASYGVAVGDVNGDGWLDAVVATWGEGCLVYTNTGAGLLANSGQMLGANLSYDVALGDFNKDGRLDIFLANDGPNKVYLNTGAGVFVDSGLSLGSDASFKVAVGDIDGDGNLDAAVANQATNRVFMGNGAGGFSVGQAVGSAGNALALGDFNADGRLDAMIVHDGADTVYTNNGTGTLVGTGQGLGSEVGAGVAVGDVNGDGALDAFVANANAGSLVWLNQTASGALGVSPPVLTFNSVPGANPAPQTFTVTNMGVAVLAYTNVVTYGDGATGWFTPAAVIGALAAYAGQVHTGTVNTVGLPEGTFYATNAVTSPEAGNSPQSIQIVLVNTNGRGTLTVVSPHGTAVPPAGTNVVGYSPGFVCQVTDSPVTNGGYRYTCAGWTGAGSVPPAGGATTTGPFNLTNNSAIAWLWTTNYWLGTAVAGSGAVDVASQWCEPGTSVTIRATASNGWAFVRWTGQVPLASAYANPLTLTMDQPRSATAVFGLAPSPTHYVSPGGVPRWPYTNWVDAATNIQDAVDVADAGDAVVVSNGVYASGGRVVFGAMTNRLVVTNAISVRSVNGAAVTILAGTNSVRGVYLGGGACLSGFTITNGHTRASGDVAREQSGGGAWCAAGGMVSNCVIAGNAAAQNGGGVYGGTLRNCLMLRNSATNSGGGLWGATAENCTIVSNSAAAGGGVYGSTVRNGIVWDNTAGVSNNYGGSVFAYACTKPLPAGTGNITNDPQFVSAAAGNYRLQATSPCLDAGINLAWVFGATDLDGAARVLNDRVDMGAYEALFRLDLRVFLEGPYDTGSGAMSTSLLAAAAIPLASPYAADRRTVAAVPTNVTDWVLVQFRGTNGTVVAAKSVFLGRDGYVVGDDGRRGIMPGLAAGATCYAVVEHRNHLAVMSASPLTFTNGTTTYDFTVGSDRFYGGAAAAVELAAGVWGMRAGDADGDGAVRTVDEEIRASQAGLGGYRRGDFDLDGSVTVSDQSQWTVNAGCTSAVADAATVLSPSLSLTPPRAAVSVTASQTFRVSGATSAVYAAMVRNPSGGTGVVQGASNILYTAGETNGTVDILEAWTLDNRLARAPVNVASVTELAAAGKAVIVAGSKGPHDPLWSATDYLADFAYETLLYRGFMKDFVRYLSPEQEDVDGNGLQDDVDTNSTLADIAFTFTNWVGNADRLFVYLVDHGGTTSGEGYFQVSQGERLMATDLDGWLDAWQDQYGKDVTVVLDFCKAAAFATNLTYGGTAQRLVIASCGANESTFFVAGGLVSFSVSFFSGVLAGNDVATCFSAAAGAVAGYQTPERSGGTGEGVYVGPTYSFGVDRPNIGQVVGNQLLAHASTATLWADGVLSLLPVARVWCVIVPPGYSADPANPVGNLTELDLAYSDTAGRYEGTYGGFSLTGTYQVVFYAQDEGGNVSFPRQSLVFQTAFDDRLVLIAGGPTGDVSWAAIDYLATLVNNTFQTRGFDAGTIRYLGADTNRSGVDAACTLANVQEAITNWANPADRLTVYLIGGETNGEFRLNAAEVLSASNLDACVDQFQSSNRAAYVVMEFPGAGGYVASLTPPDGYERIVIASAARGEAATWDADGQVSFSQYFMSAVLNGETIGGAFDLARRAIWRATGDAPQTPQLDDDGNGVANETGTDGDVADVRYFGSHYLAASSAPTIGQVVPETLISTGATVTIWASDITDIDGISNVWCVITPPAQSNAVTLIHQALAWNPTAARYEAVYAGFDAPGAYGLAFFAQDELGNISPPAESLIFSADAYEEDNSYTNATRFRVGRPQTHTFHTSGDEDWVRFHATTGLVFEIEAEQIGTNVDVELEVYYQVPYAEPTKIAWLSVNNEGRGDGKLEATAVDMVADPDLKPGVYYVRVKSADPSPDAVGAYALRIYVAAGGGTRIFLVDAWDNFNPESAPPGAYVTANGKFMGYFNLNTPYDLSASSLSGTVLVGVPSPAGYLPDEDPSLSNQVSNPWNANVGNPRYVTIGEFTYEEFGFVPIVRVTGLVKDSLTGAAVTNAAIKFTGASAPMTGLTYNGYPQGASYKSRWRTANTGEFPANVWLPYADWDLTITCPGYSNLVRTGAVKDATKGQVVALGALFMTPTNPAPTWLLAASVSGARPVVSWDSSAGKQYAVERSTNLAAGFAPFATLEGGDGRLACTDATATAAGPYYYRVADVGASTTTRTDNVVGYACLNVRSNAYNLLSLPFQPVPVCRGAISSNRSATIYDDRAAWTNGQFAASVTGQQATGASTFYVEISDAFNALKGRWFTIATNTATTLTVAGGFPTDVSDGQLDGAAYAIVPAWRVRDIFGEPGSALLTGSSSEKNADGIMLWDSAKSSWKGTIYYKTGNQAWTRGVVTKVDNEAVARDIGLCVRRVNGGDVSVRVTGEVPLQGHALVLKPGRNMVGGWCQGDVIGGSGLSNVLAGARYALTADTITGWKPSGGWDDAVYWSTNASKWVRGATVVDNTFVLEAGGAYLFRLKASVTNKVWRMKNPSR